MVVVDVPKMEELIRNTALTKGIRTSEFFLDFDKMRSGYVTSSQFFRVLWENFGLKFLPEEEQAMSFKYDVKKNGMMNYRGFCDVINLPFDPNRMTFDPRCQQLEPRELLGTSRSVRPLTPDSETYMEGLMRRLQTFYERRGIFVRTQCKDFDPHNSGVITESQFFRSFIQPTGLTEEDIAKLVLKYRDPDRPGYVNYFNIANDLETLGKVMEEEKAPYLPRVRDLGDYLPRKPRADQDLQHLLDRIRVDVYKNSVRSTEFFKDYDKLRTGAVTMNQFIAGLHLAIGKAAQLTEPEMVKLAEFYKLPDGKVEYREFCDMLENAFTIPDLEKKPTQDVMRPPEGYLGRNLPILMDSEEARLREVISMITDQVQQRRLMMYQYFKDFDRSMAYSRVITPTQFGRMLSFLSISVSPGDFRLLCLKFADPTTGDINYPAFVQTVDKDFVNYTQDTVKDYQRRQAPPLECGDSPPRETIDFDSLMQRLRHHVLVNRIRVDDCFKDFDHLRTGLIAKDQFLRGLSTLGLSSLGQHNLTEAQFEALALYYADPKDKNKILWTRFETDLESVFTIPNLEKMPTVQVPPSEIFTIPKPGTMDWRFASPEQRERCDKIINRLSAYVAERRAHLLPYFKSFDKLNSGHISRVQFRQALSMALLHCSEEEMQTLEAKFANDSGINYMAFFREIEPVEPPKFLYIDRMKAVRQINEKKNLPEFKPSKDLETVLLKVRSKVFRERIRVHDWMADHDKLNSGRISKVNFRRALNLSNLGLQESDWAILEDHYQTAGDPGCVDYLRFDDDVEKIFATKHMDKMPTVEPHQFQLPEQLRMNGLLPEHEKILHTCMQRIADKVRVVRISLFPLFQDFDPVNTGCVSRSQFRRVLNELELAGLAPTETEWNCLWEKFSHQVGGREDVDYLAFCDVVYGMAGFAWRHP